MANPLSFPFNILKLSQSVSMRIVSSSKNNGMDRDREWLFNGTVFDEMFIKHGYLSSSRDPGTHQLAGLIGSGLIMVLFKRW